MSKASMGVGVVGVLLVLASIVGPWWSLSFAVSAFGTGASGHVDLGLFGGNSAVASPAGSQVQTVSYANATHVGGVFAIGALLAFLGVVLGLVMVVMAGMSGARPQMRRIAGVLGILAFLVALLSPIYVMASLPTALSLDSSATGTGATGSTITGFWGSQTTTLLGASASIVWGAGWGWYLAFIGSILLLVGGLLAFRAPRMAPMAPPMQPPMQGYPQQYQQPYPPQPMPPQQWPPQPPPNP